MLETETRRRRGRPNPRYRIEARGAVPRGRCGATLARRKQKRAPGQVRTSVVSIYKSGGTRPSEMVWALRAPVRGSLASHDAGPGNVLP